MLNHEAHQNEKGPMTPRPAPDYAAAVAAARPKVKELLTEYLANPTGDAGAIVESLVLAHVAGEPAREADVLSLHIERGRYHTLSRDAGRTATRITRQNRRLKRALAKKTAGQENVRHYLEKVVAGKLAGKEPTPEEIIKKISTAMGISGPLIPRVEKGPVPFA
ncbi:MAG TPA: hypothetical protein VKM93_08915 [Terriglobia bacterium]|nr:hypothetical protein [Terriglobia bacterium]